MSKLPQINFTHTGIFCADLAMMVDYYCQKIGFVVSDEGVASTGHRLFFLTQNPEIHHQLVLFEGKPDNLPFNPINQLSFLLNSLDDLRLFYKKAVEFKFNDIDQVDHGNAWSMYFRDPEGNPLEMYVDTPFYTHQPCREPLDLTQSSEQIIATTKAMCQRRPDFMSRDEWMQATRERIERLRA